MGSILHTYMDEIRTPHDKKLATTSEGTPDELDTTPNTLHTSARYDDITQTGHAANQHGVLDDTLVGESVMKFRSSLHNKLIYAA